MHADFWHQRWAHRQIGFHLDHVNPHLQEHLPSLGLQPGSRLLLPLCGKTLDIHWLLAQGHAVTGIELSEIAVTELFAECQRTPTITACGPLRHYQADRLEIWHGDVFALAPSQIGKVDAIYDRAALVALPADLRGAYTRQLIRLAHAAPQLLVSLAYDQSQHSGPPFSVPATEIQTHYAAHYQRTLLADVAVALKGGSPAQEQVWLLHKSGDA